MFLNEMTEHLIDFKADGPLEEVAPLIVAYRPVIPNERFELHAQLLGPDPDPSGLFPGAPNREAVAYNLRNSVRGFEGSFDRFRALAEAHDLAGWRDLLRFNLRHMTESVRNYTNGQRTVTCLPLAEGGLSVALHDRPGSFMSDYARKPSLQPDKTATAGTLEDAEQLALEWLEPHWELEVAVSIGDRLDTMHWRPWGSRADASSYSDGVVLSLEDRRVWTETGWGAVPYKILNQLDALFPGIKAATCATCEHFRFSGMLHSMSQGSRGYCMQRYGSKETPLRRWTTKVVNRCDQHSLIDDKDRKIPYIHRNDR